MVEMPGAVAPMALLPIPVAFPPNKKDPAHRPDRFCGGDAGNRTRVLRWRFGYSPSAVWISFSLPRRSPKRDVDRHSYCLISLDDP